MPERMAELDTMQLESRDYPNYANYDLLDDIVTADYSWSAVGVFRRKSDGQLFFAGDGGCSCYGPWERAEAELEFVPLRGHWEAFKEDVERARSDEAEGNEFLAQWARYA